MSGHRSHSLMQWTRRSCQCVFLCLFLYLVMLARWGGNEPSPLLALFFDFDPLVSVATWLSTHTLAAGSLLSLITIAVTLLLARVFCGWVCPLGTVHHLMTWLGQRGRRPRVRESRSPWQRLKYLLVVGLLVMTLFGVHWVGVFDPLSLFYRSMTAFGVPAAHYVVEDSATSVYRADPKVGDWHVTSVTEPVYKFFRDRVFFTKRQGFQGSSLIALLFVLILALNLVRPRFWCRYVCPLGGGLGFISQWPALHLENNADLCNNCGLWARVCPAAAQPDQP
ncbi:MAG TPA: 4Fe-4S binding protein, partial [Candidatus Hydrogenedentes bacterium]|nr:4Fe-4S binding protein [Candidatus Hydrogenedentota bacterium]